MSEVLDAAALDTIFRTARTRNGWSDKPIPEGLLREIYDVAKFGPTSANASPARFVFVTSPEAREKLAAIVGGSNGAKIRQAPCTVIVGYDLDFTDHLPRLFPHEPTAASWFAEPAHGEKTAFRNGTLQGAYLMVAARALGLDCGPMSGFNNDKVDAEYFPSGRIKSNFLCSLGYGTDENLFPRHPRLDFDEACQVL